MSLESELGTFRTIQIPYARPGMPLARAAVTENGRIIFTTGTVLDEGRIKILRNTYMRYIHVWDDGRWNLPEEAYKADSEIAPPAEDTGTVQAVDGLLASIRGLNNDLVKDKKIGVESLRKMGGEIFTRINKEPIFQIFLKIDRSANYLFSHMVNVGVISVAVCRSMGLSAKEIWDIFVGGMLLDVGMMQVREELWLSDKRLSDFQRAEIEKHAEFGYNAIRRAKGAEEQWAIPALEHHERIDGSGYPDRKNARSLSLGSRILAVCDVYESLLHDRLWRKAFSPDAAIRELLRQPDKFDREILSHLAKTIGVYPVGSRVKLSDNREAEVVGTNAADLLRPVVQIANNGGAVRVDLSARPDLSIAGVLSSPLKR